MNELPIARNSDPAASHLAADYVTATGKRAAQQRLAILAVSQYPGLTSLELAQRSTLDRYMLARRLPECEHALEVRRGQERRCTLSGRLAVTWWIRGTIQQTDLFNKERIA